MGRNEKQSVISAYWEIKQTKSDEWTARVPEIERRGWSVHGTRMGQGQNRKKSIVKVLYKPVEFEEGTRFVCLGSDFLQGTSTAKSLEGYSRG